MVYLEIEKGNFRFLNSYRVYSCDVVEAFSISFIASSDVVAILNSHYSVSILGARKKVSFPAVVC